MNYSQSFQKRIITHTWIAVAVFCIYSLPLAADSPLNPKQKATIKKPLTNMHNQQEPRELKTAVQINCRKFSEPLFTAQKPTQCRTDRDCQKRLETHLCQASKPDTCDQLKLWQPVKTLIGLPKGAEIIRVTSKHQTDKHPSSLLLCVHFSNKSKRYH